MDFTTYNALGIAWSLRNSCEKLAEGLPALGFCAYNVNMKLYNFEKYYLSLFAFKLFIIFKKVFSYKLAQYVGIFVFYILILSITGIIMVYFFLGFNAFLDKIHLGQYKIMEFPLMQAKVDLKQFYSN